MYTPRVRSRSGNINLMKKLLYKINELLTCCKIAKNKQNINILKWYN